MKPNNKPVCALVAYMWVASLPWSRIVYYTLWDVASVPISSSLLMDLIFIIIFPIHMCMSNFSKINTIGANGGANHDITFVINDISPMVNWNTDDVISIYMHILFITVFKLHLEIRHADSNISINI